MIWLFVGLVVVFLGAVDVVPLVDAVVEVLEGVAGHVLGLCVSEYVCDDLS